MCQSLLNSFHVTVLFLYLLKMSENLWFSNIFRGYWKRPVVWNRLMYQLLFITTNLLLILYPLLLIKSMTYSLVIRFSSQSLVMRYRALNNAPQCRYLTEFWNLGYRLRVQRTENYLCIRKCNDIKNYSKNQIKLKIPKIRYGYQVNKKKLSFKNQCDQWHIPNPWHIQNPQIFKW